MRQGKATAVGAATAIVVGLVAVTPAAGFISPMNAILLGAIAAVPSYFGLVIRAKTNLDDSLDVVAAHGVGGTVGALLTGVFAEKSLNGLADGLLYGNPGQLVIQATAVGADHRLQRRRDVHPAEGHRRGAPAARRRDRGERRPRPDAARRRGLRARRGQQGLRECRSAFHVPRSTFVRSSFPVLRERRTVNRDRTAGTGDTGIGERGTGNVERLGKLSYQLMQEQADVGHEPDGL